MKPLKNSSRKKRKFISDKEIAQIKDLLEQVGIKTEIVK